jgi:SAM-dependent methyltransferase
MGTYDKDFASVYNRCWAFWGPKMWSFLSPIISKEAPSSKTWLDLCCGTGSLLSHVCKSGFSATGVDISKYQIKHAQLNAPKAKFIVQDVRKLSLTHKFDAITSMFDSLNYLTRSNDLLKVFRIANCHLANGGIFVFDMNTFEGLQDQWCKVTTTHKRDLTLIMETSFEPRKACGCCLITGFIRMNGAYRKFQEKHIERGYKAGEIERMLSQAGFSFKKYDGNTLGRPTKRSGRLLYLCKSTKSCINM